MSSTLENEAQNNCHHHQTWGDSDSGVAARASRASQINIYNIFAGNCTKKSLKARITSTEFISCHFPIVPTVSRHLVGTWSLNGLMSQRTLSIEGSLVRTRHSVGRLILQPTSPPIYDQCQCAGLKQTQN